MKLLRIVGVVAILGPLATQYSFADTTAAGSYQSAMDAYALKNYQEAIIQAEAAVKADPTLWQAWQLDGNARMALGDRTGAIAVYQYALQQHPDNPELRAYIAQLESQQSGQSATTRNASVGSLSTGNGGAAKASEENSLHSRSADGEQTTRLGRSISLGARYYMVSLSEINEFFTGLVDRLNAASTSTDVINASLKMPAGIISLELEAEYPIVKPFGALVRLDYGLPASIVYLVESYGSSFNVTQKYTFKLTTLQAVLGISGQFPVTKKLAFGASLVGGWLRLNVAEVYEHIETAPMTDHSGSTHDFAGSAPAFEFRCNAVYALAKHVDVILDAGYEYAKVNWVKATEDAPAPFGTKKGDIYPREHSGTPVPWDLSGMGAHLALRYRF
jgi:tetratricopeptide (TPR) repeat protein